MVAPDVADDARRVADDHRPVGYRGGDDRSRPHHRVPPDRYAR